MTLQHRSDEESETASTATADGDETERSQEHTGAAAGNQPATMEANRLWDDFDGDNDSDETETGEDATAAATTEQAAETQQPTTEESFGDVLETLSSFGQSTSPTQVLVLSPTSHSVTNDIFTQITSSAETSQNVVFVSSVQSTSNRLPMLRDFPSWVEGKSTLIEVGNPQSGSSTRGTNTLDRKVDTYKEVANPQNLAKLGVVISHEINRIDNQYPTVLCFHTLSSIQQYLGTQSIVPFLYTLCSKCNDSGVMGYCHLDPNRHTADAVGTIKSVFDVTVTITPGGDVEIE
ncbi:hypothetical protein EGH24_00110 [Halonotius terrestris]|uniref:Uncharacterized protein n=1 Tax=Halonotius terrestris TaxID=2487750 RepID=A0A8J8TDF2_9EURY|nr:hypothetical protein [Halonotius terrestris]TQQ83247.1 hypothetical protein EGH24_00110 [Halonotius terrestris]